MAISEQLQRRIDNFGMGTRTPRGSMSMSDSGVGAMFKQAAPRMQNMPRDPNIPVETMPMPLDPNFEPNISPLDELTPDERNRLLMEIESAQIRENAPMGLEAQQIQEMGTGEDQFLVHTEMGDTIIPPQMLMDDPELESMLERKFMDYNINPEERVVGSGIASLNPQTGLPEYGFFKKLIRGIGKVVKKVAPVAAFIPGIGTALGGVLGGIGGGITSAIGTVAPRLASGLGSLGSTVMGGISSLGIPGVSSIAGGTAGSFGGIKGALTTRSGLFGGGPLERIMGADPSSTAVRSLEAAREAAMASGDMEQVAAIDAQLATYGAGGGLYNQPQIIGTDPATGAPIYGQPQQAGSRMAQGLGGFIGGQGGGGLFGGSGGDFLKNAGIGALAASLGKLAYEDTKNMKGVPITPMTAMGPTGRFNIEAEIARRRGLEAPNPVEFGLLPQGTIPELSGGKPIMNAAYGGEVRGVPMRVLQPTAVPSMMPLPQAPMNINIPESLMSSIRDQRPPSIEQTMPPISSPPMRNFNNLITFTDEEKRNFTHGPDGQPLNTPLVPRQIIENKEISNRLKELKDRLREQRPPSIEYIPKIVDDPRPPRIEPMPMPMPMPMPDFPMTREAMMPAIAPQMLTLQPKGLSSITEKIRRRGRGMRKRAMGGEISSYNMGGMLKPMAYAEGGDVAMEDFERMNGKINGEGTETSDDVPAMLSDGEFVMTGQAVRGAGDYVMEKKAGGIISLVPSLGEDRERGTQLMYGLMDEFGSRANG